MSLAHGEVPNTLVTSFALYWHNQLQEGPGRFGGACSANHGRVLLRESSAEGGGVSGERFQHLFLFLMVLIAGSGLLRQAGCLNATSPGDYFPGSAS